MPKANAAPRADVPKPDSEREPADHGPEGDEAQGLGPDGGPPHAPDHAPEHDPDVDRASSRDRSERTNRTGRTRPRHDPPEAEDGRAEDTAAPHMDGTASKGDERPGGNGGESGGPAEEGGVHTSQDRREPEEARGRTGASGEQPERRPEPQAEGVKDGRARVADRQEATEPPEPRNPTPAHHEPAPEAEAEAAEATDTVGDTEGDADDAPDTNPHPRLTPRQARGIRAAISTVVMLAVAVALAARLNSTPSVLTVGFYGMALVLSGTAVVLSRRGRTRVATGALLAGFALVLFAEQLLPSGQ